MVDDQADGDENGQHEQLNGTVTNFCKDNKLLTSSGNLIASNDAMSRQQNNNTTVDVILQADGQFKAISVSKSGSSLPDNQLMPGR